MAHTYCKSGIQEYLSGWFLLRVSNGVMGQVSQGWHRPDTGLGFREDGGPASRWHFTRPLAGASVQVLSRTSARGVVPKSKEEATMCVISSLRNQDLVFLEYPVGYSVSPASPLVLAVCHCPELPGASAPGAPLKGGCRTRRETRTRVSVPTHAYPLYCERHWGLLRESPSWWAVYYLDVHLNVSITSILLL